MPDPEFDLYVSVLARLLRLSHDQKQQIEHEFRDHFEERLNDLLQRGVPRDAAVRQAIDEFGDAAGLARELTHLSRRKLRRSLMRYTIATAAIGAVILLIVNAFMPEHAGVPAPRDAQAQQDADAVPAEAAAENEPAATVDVPEIVWIDPAQFVPEPLARSIDVELLEVPLDEALHEIAGQIQVPLLIDVQGLNDQGLAIDELVTVQAAKEPAFQVLDRLLDLVGGVPLACTFETGILHVTTKEIYDERLTTLSYNVSDLLNVGYDSNSLVDLIQNETTGPWFDLDGIGGTISDFGKMLTIRQTASVQREAAALLDALRTPGLERRLISEAVDRKLQAQLSQPIAVEYVDVPLVDVVADINDRCGTNLRLDLPELENEGITADHPVTITLPERPLHVVLDYLFRYVPGLRVSLVWLHGELVITPRSVGGELLVPVVYEVSSIVQGDRDAMAGLIELIQHQTEGPWFDTDGIGGTISAPVPDVMVVRQTAEMQEEVRQIISIQRSAASRPQSNAAELVEAQQSTEVRYYRLDADTVNDLLQSLPELVAPGTWASTSTVDGEPVQLTPGGIGTLRKVASGRRVFEVAPMSTLQGVGGSDSTGNVASSELIVIPQATLIVKHKRSVHREVQRELRSLATPPQGDFIADDRTGGGFGFQGGFF